MFRQTEKRIDGILQQYLREEGLETPLLEKRLIDSLPNILGSGIKEYIKDASIRNQVLYLRITSPALRSDLMMTRTALITRLNNEVKSQVITEIKIS